MTPAYSGARHRQYHQSYCMNAVQDRLETPPESSSGPRSTSRKTDILRQEFPDLGEKDERWNMALLQQQVRSEHLVNIGVPCHRHHSQVNWEKQKWSETLQGGSLSRNDTGLHSLGLSGQNHAHYCYFGPAQTRQKNTTSRNHFACPASDSRT